LDNNELVLSVETRRALDKAVGLRWKEKKWIEALNRGDKTQAGILSRELG